MKTDRRLARCAIKGSLGDALHVVLCGYGHSIRIILGHLRACVVMILAALMAAIVDIIAKAAPRYTKTGAAA